MLHSDIYLINQAQGMTSYQLLKGNKLIISFLHVFGSKFNVLQNQGEIFDKFETKGR